MTHEEKIEILRQKTIELANGAHKLVLEEIERVFKTNGNGAIEYDEYGDDYELPKIVLYAVMKDVVMNQVRPVFQKNRDEAENLYQMI